MAAATNGFWNVHILANFGGKQPIRYRAAIIVNSRSFVRVAGQGPDGPLLVEAVSYLVVQRGNVKMNE
jgi:hypothetical protein